jgi:hypothetical protein
MELVTITSCWVLFVISHNFTLKYKDNQQLLNFWSNVTKINLDDKNTEVSSTCCRYRPKLLMQEDYASNYIKRSSEGGGEFVIPDVRRW